MSFEWKIYARDQNYQRQGEIDEYREATFTPVYNDVGTWEIVIDRRSDQAAALTTPGWGIMLTRDGAASRPLLSGTIVQRHHVVSTDQSTITISGVTDEVWLKRRLASPSPSESTPPYTVQATDNLTGVASTVVRHYVDVNAGPSAVSARRVPGLTMATDPVVGASVVGSARWDNLLELIQPIAHDGGVGFRVVQVGAGLQFQVYQGTDRSGTIKFSIPLGTMAGFEYQTTAPTGNYVFIGGTGDGTTRVMQELNSSSSIATWGRVEGSLVNSDTADTAKMKQDGNAALEQGAEQTSLSITPVEINGMRYGIDYFLGDTVSALIEGPGDGTVVDKLRSVSIHLTPDGPQTVTSSIGTARAADVMRLSRTFRYVTSLAKRLTILERH
ncbi:MAG: hypothetical protein AUG44_08755 [Actinobacteria bacterium 13_1_20CM_3_71_11]|nr:MAG: hypothetical protein AUG44_08755 [Actinobacteria bacterium 13_1_20CM_3_71_11]